MAATRFPLGRLIATAGALQALRRAGQTPDEFLDRHAAGDWGDVDEGDSRANDLAVAEGARLLSSYQTAVGEKIWIITEADRSSTALLLPEQY